MTTAVGCEDLGIRDCSVVLIGHHHCIGDDETTKIDSWVALRAQDSAEKLVSIYIILEKT